MIGNLLGGIQKYLLAGAGLVIAGLVVALKIISAQKAAARAEAVQYKVKAKGEEAARKHVTDTVEKTRETEDAIRRSDSDRVSDELREYARGDRADDSD